MADNFNPDHMLQFVVHGAEFGHKHSQDKLEAAFGTNNYPSQNKPAFYFRAPSPALQAAHGAKPGSDWALVLDFHGWRREGRTMNALDKQQAVHCMHEAAKIVGASIVPIRD